MKYLDIGIDWFYKFITFKLGVTKHHDKWLHVTLIAIYVSITFFVLLALSVDLIWSVVSAQLFIFGREVYNVVQRLRDGYDLYPAYKDGWDWNDIVAGELGAFGALMTSLVVLMFLQILSLI